MNDMSRLGKGLKWLLRARRLQPLTIRQTPSWKRDYWQIIPSAPVHIQPNPTLFLRSFKVEEAPVRRKFSTTSDKPSSFVRSLMSAVREDALFSYTKLPIIYCGQANLGRTAGDFVKVYGTNEADVRKELTAIMVKAKLDMEKLRRLDELAEGDSVLPTIIEVKLIQNGWECSGTFTLGTTKFETKCYSESKTEAKVLTSQRLCDQIKDSGMEYEISLSREPPSDQTSLLQQVKTSVERERLLAKALHLSSYEFTLCDGNWVCHLRIEVDGKELKSSARSTKKRDAKNAVAAAIVEQLIEMTSYADASNKLEKLKAQSQISGNEHQVVANVQDTEKGAPKELFAITNPEILAQDHKRKLFDIVKDKDSIIFETKETERRSGYTSSCTVPFWYVVLPEADKDFRNIMEPVVCEAFGHTLEEAENVAAYGACEAVLGKRRQMQMARHLLRAIPEPSEKGLSFFKMKLPMSRVFLVNHRRHLARLEKSLNSAVIVGIDTESQPSYKKGVVQQVALIQIAVRDSTGVEEVHLLDVSKLGLSSFIPVLRRLLSNDKIIKLGQGLREDIVGLRKGHKLAETDILASLSSIVEVNDLSRALTGTLKFDNLARLVRSYLGVNLSKSQQMSNWRRRPLTEAQIHYAASDALVLLRLYDKLWDGLQAKYGSGLDISLFAQSYDVTKRNPRNTQCPRCRRQYQDLVFLYTHLLQTSCGTAVDMESLSEKSTNWIKLWSSAENNIFLDASTPEYDSRSPDLSEQTSSEDSHDEDSIWSEVHNTSSAPGIELTSWAHDDGDKEGTGEGLGYGYDVRKQRPSGDSNLVPEPKRARKGV